MKQILDSKFEDLLTSIALYFSITEQNDFESYDVNDENLIDHNYLKFVDLTSYLIPYVPLDFEVAIRLLHIEKYKNFVRTNLNDDEIDLENPYEWKEVCLQDENLMNYKFILHNP